MLGVFKVFLEGFWFHFFEKTGHHAPAGVFGEFFLMFMNEVPVETIPGVTPISFGIVAHFKDIV